MSDSPKNDKIKFGTILPVIVMVGLIVLLTLLKVQKEIAIGAPVAIMVIWSIMQQKRDTQKAKQHFLGKVGKENLSKIATKDRLHLIRLDNMEMFLDEMEVPFGEYQATFQHERMVLAKMVLTEFKDVKIKTVKGQQLLVGWNYLNNDMTDIALTFEYQDI